MRSGLHAIISLDGAAVARADAAALGLSPGDVAAPVVARAIDTPEPGAVHVAREPARVTLLLGHLDDAAGAARALGLAANTPPALLARGALDRHGAEAARVLGGEWSLLDWTPHATMLLGSPACRDPLLYAHRGTRLAVSSDLDRLARLSWVGRTIDPTGFAFAVARAALRQGTAGRTILAGVRTLATGTLARFDAAGMTLRRCAPFAPVAPFAGTFEDAMAEADRVVRGIVRERLARTPEIGSMLSGGLDSSFIAMLATQERSGGKPLVCLCSAAVPGSGVPDESSYAQIVADRLGARLERVVPPALPSPYRPVEAELLGPNAPSMSPRHHVYTALDARAAALGLPGLLDGSFGEMTMSAYALHISFVDRMRAVWHQLRGRGDAAGGSPPGPVHVRLAPHRMRAAALLAREAVAPPIPLAPPHARTHWGVQAGAEEMYAMPTSRLTRRTDVPFRDPRLIALFASFPTAFMQHDGVARAPVRHLMRGHLPDSIRLREMGMPFSPDCELRLQRDAPEALARIPAFRAGGLDDWIDLDWLEAGLARVAARGATAATSAVEVQLTAMAAEYLSWWQDRP